MDDDEDNNSSALISGVIAVAAIGVVAKLIQTVLPPFSEHPPVVATTTTTIPTTIPTRAVAIAPEAQALSAASSATPVAKPPSAAVQITARDRAVLDLKLQRDRLDQLQVRLALTSDRDTLTARQLVAQGRRDDAGMVLRRRKMLQKHAEAMAGMWLNVHKMIDAIEMAEFTSKVFEGLKQGNDALKMLQQQVNVDTVALVLQEGRERRQVQEQITNMLNDQQNQAWGLDQSDLEQVQQELQQLIQNDNQQLPANQKDHNIRPAQDLPKVSNSANLDDGSRVTKLTSASGSIPSLQDQGGSLQDFNQQEFEKISKTTSKLPIMQETISISLHDDDVQTESPTQRPALA